MKIRNHNSLLPFSQLNKIEPFSSLKGKALAFRSQGQWFLSFRSYSISKPIIFAVTLKYPFKEGQVYDAIIKFHQDKWEVSLSYNQIYEEVECSLNFQNFSNSTLEKILIDMGLPLLGKQREILEKFSSLSPWSKRLIALGILNNFKEKSLVYLNFISDLSWEIPLNSEFNEVISSPLKKNKNKKSSIFWWIIPCSLSLKDKKWKGVLYLGTSHSATVSYDCVKKWSFVTSFKEYWIWIKVDETDMKSVLCILPESFQKYEDHLKRYEKKFEIFHNKYTLRFSFMNIKKKDTSSVEDLDLFE